MIVYFSGATGNTQRFVEKLGLEATRIPIKADEIDSTALVGVPFVLITPSYGSEKNNHIPPQVKKFFGVPEHRKLLRGVIGTGSINFGEEYAAGAKFISGKSRTPLLYNLELAGTEDDVTRVKEGLDKFWQQIE